jgi:hypothetical protein
VFFDDVVAAAAHGTVLPAEARSLNPPDARLLIRILSRSNVLLWTAAR